MQLNERLQFLARRPGTDEILASGREGGLYRLSADLELLARTPITEYDNPICALAVHEKYAFTRDNFGTIARWDLDSMRPVDVLVAGRAKDESELDKDDNVVPSICHALTVWNGHVYVTNGYGQILELDSATFALRRIIDANKESFTETIETSVPGRHVLSDFNGWLWFGDLATGRFERRLRLDHGPVHCVRYDRRHDRYWATTDNQGGFKIVEKDGAAADLVKMTTDDVEWIDFDGEQTTVYVACFDHHLYVYDNTAAQPTLKRVVGPFKYQLKQVLHLDGDRVYVLLQSGEVYRLDASGRITAQTDFEGRAVWGLDVHPNDPGLVYAALEEGSVALLAVAESAVADHVEIVEIDRHRFAFGRVRRVVPFADGSYVAISAHGVVFRGRRDGSLMWHHRVLGLVRDVNVSRGFDKILVGTEAGLALELDATDGTVIRTIQIQDPIWCVMYGDCDECIVGHRRKIITVWGADGGVPLATLELRENLKRLRRLPSGNVLVNGPEGIVEIEQGSWTVVKRFSDWVLQTCENAVVVGDRAYGVHYNLSLITYDYATGEPLDAQLPVRDYPLGMVTWTNSIGKTHLLIGGRGGYVSVFRLDAGVPQKTRDLFL